MPSLKNILAPGKPAGSGIPTPIANGKGLGQARSGDATNGENHAAPRDVQLDATQAGFAITVLRLEQAKRVSQKSRDALTKPGAEDWRALVDYVEESRGLFPVEKRSVEFFNSHSSCRPDRVSAMRLALDAARKHAERTGGIQDESDGPSPYSLELVDSSNFFSQEYHLEWLVKGVIVKGDAGAIGGPSKSLKTSIAVDLIVSAGAGVPFLGRFDVPKPLRVALISGETGHRGIQNTARQVCIAREVDSKSLKHVFWGFKVPQLTCDAHLEAIRLDINRHGLELLVVDPFYLALMSRGAGVDPKNMFEMGPILANVAQVCLESGCTPIIAHHFIKNRENAYASPDLGNLAYAGFGQFMRQWMLVAPRERYDAETGLFKLHFVYGGSAGHCGEFAVDIEVGKMDPDLDRRKWTVTFPCLSEDRVAGHEMRQAEETQRMLDNKQLKEATKRQSEQKEVARALEILRKQPDRRLTANRLKEASGWRSEKCKRIFFLLTEGGHAITARFTVPKGQNGHQEVDGIELCVLGDSTP